MIQFIPRLPSTMSKIPGSARLAEVSDSVHNARQKGMRPPPPVNSLKRKTLAEQANEPYRPATVAPGSRVSSNTIKGGSLASLNRHNSYASSTSSRPASAASSSYRNASNSSIFSQSYGSGRTVSSQSSRPHTVASVYPNGPKYGATSQRSMSSVDQHGRDVRDVNDNGSSNNSMRKVSSSSRQSSTSRKREEILQESRDSQSGSSSLWPSSYPRSALRGRSVRCLRDVSLSTQMSTLTIKDKDIWQDQDLKESAKVERICNAPQTPSMIPKKKQSIPFTPAPEVASPTKTRKKTPKAVGWYLTKDSNIKVADSDVGDRMGRIESCYEEIKGQVEAATGERENFTETLLLLKTRSRSTSTG